MEILYIRLSTTKTFNGQLAVRELEILLTLSNYTLEVKGEKDQKVINEIILLFIHFLQTPKALGNNNDNLKIKMLNTINSLIVYVEDPSLYIPKLSSFLGEGITALIGSCRRALIDVFKTIGNHPKTKYMKPIYEIIDNLNKMEKNKIGVFDYKIITETYKKLEVDLKKYMKNKNQVILLLYQFISDMNNSDLPVRIESMELLKIFINELYSLYSNNNNIEIISLLNNPLLSSLHSYLRILNNNHLIHQNTLKIIRHIIMTFKNTNIPFIHLNLQYLCSDNVDEDFFHCVLELNVYLFII